MSELLNSYLAAKKVREDQEAKERNEIIQERIGIMSKELELGRDIASNQYLDLMYATEIMKHFKSLGFSAEIDETYRTPLGTAQYYPQLQRTLLVYKGLKPCVGSLFIDPSLIPPKAGSDFYQWIFKDSTNDNK